MTCDAGLKKEKYLPYNFVLAFKGLPILFFRDTVHFLIVGGVALDVIIRQNSVAISPFQSQHFLVSPAPIGILISYAGCYTIT